MIGPPQGRVRKLQDRALAWFDEWFSSPACVWQTLVVCLIVCIVEVAWPNLDPHFFFLLMVLTVYSAITQPALAQSNAAQAERLETIINRQADIIDMMHQELEETTEILDDVRELVIDDDNEDD